ncbi:hypothetical protein [Haloarchaeobius sp. TZWSO28]|uniref:hypothetical protein n=1 Tax=Haloarchaeobius sp. TZWSO28 TaxID=3446119 RepID=UPI003EB7FA61
MKQSRRAFVTAIAGIAGGCLSSRDPSRTTAAPDSDADGVPDRVDDYPTDDRRAFEEFRAEGTPTLHPGQFSAIALTNSPEASGDVLHYNIAVEGDTKIDCLVFEREAYDAYVDGARDVSIVSEYSRIGVTETTLTETLDEGEYIFSLDYTDLLTDPREQSVTVSRLLTLADQP